MSAHRQATAADRDRRGTVDHLVETRPSGQIAVRTLDNSGSPPGAGALFGLAVNASGPSVYYVDDSTNTLNLLF